MLAIILLTASSLFWSGNFFFGKVAHITDLSPFKLSFFRWSLALLLLLPFTLKSILENFKYYKTIKVINFQIKNKILLGFVNIKVLNLFYDEKNLLTNNSYFIKTFLVFSRLRT